jgi:hypothetical protein
VSLFLKRQFDRTVPTYRQVKLQRFTGFIVLGLGCGVTAAEIVTLELGYFHAQVRPSPRFAPQRSSQ